MKYQMIDSHCHLDIIQEHGQSIPDSLIKSKNAGVDRILQIGIDLESSIRAKEIADQDYSKFFPESTAPQIQYTIGCHPTETHEFPKADEIIELIEHNIGDPKLTAIGEIGIDLYHTAESKKYQIETLEKFLDLAERTKLPVVIHSRDGMDDTYETLARWKTRVFGVIHCFTYDYSAGKKFVDLGYYVSFSGVVVFKNATDIHDAAKKLPLDSILIETDAPFLAPPPHRGKRNDSGNLPFILEKMFSLREEPNQIIEKTIFSNSENFLNRKAYYDARSK